MNIVKKILFPLFSLFLIYRSFDLMRDLLTSDPNGYSNIEFLIISFILSMFITGIFAFVGFAYPSSRLLRDSYYEIRNPTVLNAVSKVLGMTYFRYLLIFAFWGRKKYRKKYFNGTKQGLANFMFQTKQSEFGHLAAFLTITIASAILLVHGYIFLVTITMLINIIGNMYPVILQRLHRIRIQRLSKYLKM